MKSVRIIGNVSKTCFRPKMWVKADRQHHTGLGSMDCCGKQRLELRGVICRSITAHGKQFILASVNGRASMFSENYSNH
jgi:hypothetical protein